MLLKECDTRLLDKITDKRNQLMKKVIKFGLNDKRVVNCSQELDELLNLLQRVHSEKR